MSQNRHGISNIVSLGLLGILLLVSTGAAQEPCLNVDQVVVPGAQIDLTLIEASWVEVQMRFDRVYRISTSAPAGAEVELWRLDFDEGRQCHIRDELLFSSTSAQSDTGFEWTDHTVVQDALLISPASVGGPVAVSVTLEEIAAPPADNILVVPAVAHVIGAGGELFTSDLTVFNPLDVSIDAMLTLIPTDGGDHLQVPVTVDPRATRVWEDVVSAVFGRNDISGALQISYPAAHNLVAVSHTSAETASGSFGQFIPAQPFAEAASRGAGGAVRVLPYLENSEDFRTNVGFVEVLGLEARLELAMFDEAGHVLASRELTIPPLCHHQINDVFAFLGVAGRSHAMIRADLKSHGRVFIYASVIDNHSSDPVYVPGLAVDPPRPWPGDEGEQLLLPAAAATAGAFSTVWQTDLRVVSSSAVGTVQMTFVPDSGDPSSTGTFTIAASHSLVFDDVVAQLGGSGSGHLWIRASQGELLAASRTYTTGAMGTFGQFIPAEAQLIDLDRGVLVGLRSDERFRTNVGLVNPSVGPMQVRLRLVSGTGEVLGTRLLELDSDQGRQLNDLGRAFATASICRSCRVEFERVGDVGLVGVYAWASVVDNQTGDAIFVPPSRL